jgi:hypothetical protein
MVSRNEPKNLSLVRGTWTNQPRPWIERGEARAHAFKSQESAGRWHAADGGNSGRLFYLLNQHSVHVYQEGPYQRYLTAVMTI